MTDAPDRRFRFGVNHVATGSRSEWLATCRRTEEQGYDLLLVPDHLGAPAPFPTLVAAAAATQRVRLGTFVLNAGFLTPHLLARDVAGTDQLTDGRLEIGLGTGYVKAEFDTAGLPYGTPAERLAHLRRTVEELRALLDDPAHTPAPVQRPVPLFLGGNGPRMLDLAAEHADVVGFTAASSDAVGTLALVDAATLEATVRSTRESAAARGRDPELNLLVQQVRISDTPRSDTARELATHLPNLTPEQLLEVPTLLFGTVDDIAGQVLAHRERFGFTNLTVLGPSADAFAEVIPRVRELEGR